MFINRRNFFYQSNPYLANYTQAQLQQYRSNALANQAKLQAYKEAIIEAELQSRANDMVTFVGGAMVESPIGSPNMVQDFTPCGHVSRPGSTPHSYNLWESGAASADSSKTDSITSYRKRFGQNLCRIVTACAAVLIILAVLGIVGIAVYLGYLSKEEEKPNYTDKFIGNVRILQGDSWMPDLLFSDSPAFRAKAAKYKNMFKDVFANSVLGPAFEKADINQFTALESIENSGFDLTFQLYLDRRKIPFWHIEETDAVIDTVMKQEFTSSSPVAFQNLKIVPESFSVKKLDSTSPSFEFQPTHISELDNKKYEVVPLKDTAGGIIRVKPIDVENSTEVSKPIISQTEKPKAIISQTEKPKAIIPQTEKPKAIIPQTEKSKPIIPQTEKPKAIIPQTEKPKPIIPQTEKPKRIISPTESLKQIVPQNADGLSLMVPQSSKHNPLIPDIEEREVSIPHTEKPKAIIPQSYSIPQTEKSTVLIASTEKSVIVPQTLKPEVLISQTKENENLDIIQSAPEFKIQKEVKVIPISVDSNSQLQQNDADDSKLNSEKKTISAILKPDINNEHTDTKITDYEEIAYEAEGKQDYVYLVDEDVMHGEKARPQFQSVSTEKSTIVNSMVFEENLWRPINPNFQQTSSYHQDFRDKFDGMTGTGNQQNLQPSYTQYGSGISNSYISSHEEVSPLKSSKFSKTTINSKTYIFSPTRTLPQPTLSTNLPNLPKSRPVYDHSPNTNSNFVDNTNLEDGNEITKNEFYDRLGISSASVDGSDNTKQPTLEDIQFVLENLLFLAASNSYNLLNDSYHSMNDETMTIEEKNNINHQIKNAEEYQIDDLTANNYNIPEVSYVPSYSDVRDFRRPHKFSSGVLPIDRFRNQIRNSSSQINHANAHQKQSAYSNNIWDVMTTKKPLLIDSEIVTSTSVDVKYGPSSVNPRPVYVHSTPSKKSFKLSEGNKPRPDVIIPVISGKNVKYIRINRTHANYPNVVVVNLSDFSNNETIDVDSSLFNEESRKMKLPSSLVHDMLNILAIDKRTNEISKGAVNKIKHVHDKWLNILKSKVFAIEESGLNILRNSSLLSKLSNVNKLHDNFRPLLSKFQKFWESLSTNKSSNSREPKQNSLFKTTKKLPQHESSVKFNETIKTLHLESKENQKHTNTVTLFLVKKKNSTGGKVISVSEPSGSTQTSELSTTNSPIHVFTYKGNQSLDELLAEIFDTVSQKDNNIKKPSSETKENDWIGHPPTRSDNKNDLIVPPGEDSLKVIELISEVLHSNNDYYNAVLGNNNNIPVPSADANEITTSNKKYEDITTVKSTTTTIQGNVKETDVTNSSLPESLNEIITVSYNNESPKNTTKQSYHKYHHELFPVMTRPLNPIKITTINGDTSSTTPSTDASNDKVTSFDISYSMNTGNKSVTLPIRNSNNITVSCNEEEFHCNNGKCIPVLARCNMIRDCADNSDESNCSCSDILKSQHYLRKICDGIIDCWDKTDEMDCDWCKTGHFICTGYQKCVEPELVCDGNPDCPNGDDERDCVTIAPDVIGANSVDYYDEGYLMVRQKGIWGKLCVENFEHAASKAGVSWTIADLGEAVCNTLTFDSFNRVEKAYDSSPPIFRSLHPPYYEINITYEIQKTEDLPSERYQGPHVSLKRSLSNASPLILYPDNADLNTMNTKGSLSSIANFLRGNLSSDRKKSSVKKRDVSHKGQLNLQFQHTKCISRDVVKVKCKDLQCGVRPRASTQLARIVGGNNSSPGAWPWHAALYKEGEYQCGATLIGEQWLISAGHCFYSARNAYWVARLGALRRGTKFASAFEQIRALSHIFVHPKYVNQGFINDISLLRLKDPVKVNDFVRPVCLPSPGAEVNDGQRCTLVGWGQLFEVQKVFPDTLQEVEVPVISTTECRKRTIFLPLYRITEDMFCAGYDRGGRDACLGDSGGPLMCQKSDGRWEIMGVTSNGYGCARPNRPGVYTKVVNYLKWINQVIELSSDGRVIPVEANCEGHRCALGECIPDSGICNGKAECSDGSDERNCP